jgi:hypothetical protein
MRGDDQAQRAPDAADLLDRDGVGQGVEAGPALVLGDRDAEPAEFTDAADDLGREPALALVLVDVGRYLCRHEVADGFAEQRVLLGEVEVHRPEPTIGRNVPRAPVLAFGHA